MPDGGGGGGDNGEHQAKVEQARRSDAIDKINSYFGVGPAQATLKRYADGTMMDPTATNSWGQPAIKQTWVPNTLPTLGGGGLSEHATATGTGPLSIVRGEHGETIGGTGHYEPMATTDVANPLAATAKTNATSRQALYDKTRQDVLDYDLTDLGRQATVAKRSLGFDLARQGLDRSSVENDKNTLFQQNYDTGATNAAQEADQAALGFKSSDEKSRLDLINQINAGADANTAATNAGRSLDLNTTAAANQAKGAAVGNAFSGLAQDYLYGADLRGQQQGIADYQNGGVPPGLYPRLGTLAGMAGRTY